MIKNKKLAFSAVTVRQLTQNMSDEQLRNVAGGATTSASVVGGGTLSNDFNLCGNTRQTIQNPTTGTCACQSNANRTVVEQC